VLDDLSLLHEQLSDDLCRPTITRQISRELGRFGAPYDLIHLEDVRPETSRYKLYMFLGIYHLDESALRRVHQAVCRAGVTSLWVHAPGVFGSPAGKGQDLAQRASRVTGIELDMEHLKSDLSVRVTNLDHPIARGIREPIRYGSERLIGPVLYVTDPGAEILGSVEYLHSMSRPGLCVKDEAGLRSVYSSAPNLPAALLRGIARWAGVHIYSEDGDVLYAGHGLLAVHAATSGEKTLALPRRTEIREFFGDRIVGRDTDRIHVNLKIGETVVFRI
jgi:hypothetical protein